MRLPTPDTETIEQLFEPLRAGSRSSVEVVQECLAQIDEWENEVHAWVLIDRQGALAQAAQCDADARSGRWRGPLHGIPIGIKDIIDVAGWPTGCGSPLLEREARPVATDAPLVTRLREAGAILLGKTVTTQFACFDPPVTRNPWNLARTPGGSSSGSAAAVATGMCLAAIGSQTGGSITRPASYCGVCGCKPTFGAISADGVFPMAPALDHPGPIARSVADLGILMHVLVPGLKSSRETQSHQGAAPRLGRLHGLFDEKLEPDTKRAYEQTLRKLATAGATFIDVALPQSFDDVLARHRTIVTRELFRIHSPRFAQYRDDYLPRLSELIEEGARVTPADFETTQRHHDQLRQEMAGVFGTADVLVCPATVGPAPDISTTGDPSFNAPWSYAGLPTVSFPMCLSSDGLPLSLQLVGRANDEPRLFEAAMWCEQVAGAL